jgi:hypothetical protein
MRLPIIGSLGSILGRAVTLRELNKDVVMLFTFWVSVASR